MKMEHYLEHTDYPIWEVIQKGNGPVSVTTDTQGVIRVLPPRTVEEILARERERKARTTLLMALPEDHLAKFHKMTDAKEMWDAIKSRFGGNDESKKMQKYILKQQFEGFYILNLEGLHKGYDRFQSLLSQLEIHGAGVSSEDANHKFLRSLPSSWSQVSLIMRTKPGVDTINFDDLYNNLRVFESDVKGSSASSSNTQNVAFISSESTNSTNDVSTAYGASPSSGHNSQRENSSSYTDDLMYSFFANQSSGPQLDHEDLEQIDEFDLEEMDLKWQVAMISMRLKKFYKKTGRKLHFDAKEPVGFDKTKVECYNCHKTGHFARECRLKGNQDARRRDAGNSGYKAKDNGRRPGKQEEPKALVTLDGEGIDWTAHAEDEQENFALMAFSNSGSDTEVTSCSKECVESYTKLKKLYDEQREQLSDASIEIQSYTQALKKVEAQLVTHQNNKLWYEEKIKFTKIDLDDKTDVLTYHTKYGDHRYGSILSYENEVLQSVFMNKDSNEEDRTLYDRSSDFNSCESNSSEETLECMPELVVNEPKVVGQPKVWIDAPIIEEYESDSDDDCVSIPLKEQEQPINTARASGTNNVNTTRQNPNGQVVPTSNVKKVNTVRPNVKDFRPRNNIYKSHSPFNKTFHKTTAPKANFVNQKVHTAGDKAVSADGPQRALKNKGIIDSGCSRHMTGNKAYLVDYQDYNGGPVAFEGSKGYITGKGKGPIWLFDLDYLTDSMNYQPVTDMEDELVQEYYVLPMWSSYTSIIKSSEVKVGGEKPNEDASSKLNEKPVDKEDQVFMEELERLKRQEKDANDAAKALRKEFAQDKTYADQDDTQIPDPTSAVQTRSKLNKSSGAHAFNEPKKISEALDDESWVDAIQEELLQTDSKCLDFEEGITIDEVFALCARIEAIRIFLAFASYMRFIVYQMDVKSAFLYGSIDEEVYVSQPPGFVDPKFPNKKDKKDIMLVQVYVDDIIFGSTKKFWCDEFEALMKSKFQMSSIGRLHFFLGLQVKQKEEGIFISQDKYVAEILKKFDFESVKTASTPIETQKPLVKDEEAADVDSVLVLVSVTPKTSHLHAMKRIFRYLKGKPKLGLWYPKESSFDLEAYYDSDYAGANLDKKSTTGGCQFLVAGDLISWQCKKHQLWQLLLTEAEYVAAAHYCGQVLWI
ncbi:ribonuclease H-like domain-containing protein [Tanacetum coccineum]